ncbi:SMI1/KNR4 family protein [Myxococcus sp. CA039A]|uniref:SMI1/KNR4 family protein n=1 Tax=Myxococcus sp. CA039A TaxID=2741737 RepID=UPI00157B5F59|nr:SMI1/KNR4 family protein [Myxococcus sp. CA039A]NTX53125.1 SMI1/KNR4 family protein [Myxococcus sp. CA039A]
MHPTSAIEADAVEQPMLFRWRKPLTEDTLLRWARRYGSVPTDLLRFWSSTGGGEAFETETFLSPVGDPATGDDIESVTSSYRQAGLAPGWIVFHVGLGLSAFHPIDGRFAWFDQRTGEPTQVFKSLDVWYRGTLRHEYAVRYAL